MTERIKRGTPSLREVTFLADGEPADDGTVEVLVVGSDGTEVFSGAADHPGVGRYTYPLSAQSQLDRLTETWTGDSIVHEVVVEIVGSFYFTTEEARALDSAFVEATHPLDTIVGVRAEVEDAIESYVARALGKGVAFVHRFRRITVNGTAQDAVGLPDYFVHTIRAASIGGVALTAPHLADLVAASGELTSTLVTWTRGNRNVVVAYEHGLDSPPPIIRRAALLLFKSWLPALSASSSGPSMADLKSLSAEGLSLTFGTGSSRSDTTGIASVDSLIDSWLATPGFSSVPVA